MEVFSAFLSAALKQRVKCNYIGLSVCAHDVLLHTWNVLLEHGSLLLEQGNRLLNEGVLRQPVQQHVRKLIGLLGIGLRHIPVFLGTLVCDEATRTAPVKKLSEDRLWRDGHYGM